AFQVLLGNGRTEYRRQRFERIAVERGLGRCKVPREHRRVPTPPRYIASLIAVGGQVCSDFLQGDKVSMFPKINESSLTLQQLHVRCESQGTVSMFGRGGPIAEETGRSVQFVLELVIMRITGKSTRLARPSFAPAPLSAVNESDRDFRLSIVGEKPARH